MTICYFGIYQPTWARDTVLLKGLKRAGVKIISVVDSSAGWCKWFGLWRRHRSLQEPYDFILVGYLSNLVAPLARLLSRRPVIFNAGNSMYEGAVLDRGDYGAWSPRRYLIWLIDFLAFHAAHLILVESEQQKKFLRRKFLVPPKKMAVLFAGADDAVFAPDTAIKKADTFTVLFRGWLVPATGVASVLSAAALLKNENVNFRIIGRGPLTAWVKDKIRTERLSKVELIIEFLPETELHQQMLACHLMLGQFANHSRLERTIQNKTFEALALGLPYITRDSPSNREFLTDGENCLFVNPADAADLAAKILLLKNNPELSARLSRSARALYERQLTPERIASHFLQITKNIGVGF